MDGGLARTVAGGRENPAVAHDRGADRHLAARRGGARLREGGAHRIGMAAPGVNHSSHPLALSAIRPR